MIYLLFSIKYLQPQGDVAVVNIKGTLIDTSCPLDFLLTLFPLRILDPIGNDITISS